jgi:hypothetical protein
MCCTAGWPIPVEKSRVPAIEQAIGRNVIPLRVEPWLLSGADTPEDVAGILAARDNGHCVFFESGRPGCSPDRSTRRPRVVVALLSDRSLTSL